MRASFAYYCRVRTQYRTQNIDKSIRFLTDFQIIPIFKFYITT